VQLEGAQIRVQNYPWYNLGNGQHTESFSTDGTYNRWLLRLTISGADTPNAVEISIDGNVIPVKNCGTLDRCFYEYFSATPFQAGSHSLRIRQLTAPAPGRPIRQLCSVTLHEYKPEPLFHMDNKMFVGAYPTWRAGKALTGYRPTNEYCLMRNMSSTKFCPICYEEMWRQFFSVISAIDDVLVNCLGGNVAQIYVYTVKLGQLREGGAMPGESLQVRWYFNGELLTEFNDEFSFTVDTDLYTGRWEVRVKYITPLVRYDPRNLLEFSQAFQVTSCL